MKQMKQLVCWFFENDNIKIKSNGGSKTKKMVVGDSLVKYLHGEELSSKKKTCLITSNQMHGENLIL